MATLTITTGNTRIDGVYEIDVAGGFNFTKNEWYMINKRVGVTIENFRPSAPLDMNVMTALGLIMLQRAGKEAYFDAFMETTDEQTVWVWGDEVGDEEDAAESPLTQPTGSDDSDDSKQKSDGFGTSTDGSSDTFPDVIPAATGGQT